ncbi:MAG: hypothetical protein NWF07_13840 [Candidatus Bathyarchaeota archaeon]|nr:hypothetical protein [Candidatus Bathyarchaeota archaeon]
MGAITYQRERAKNSLFNFAYDNRLPDPMPGMTRYVYVLEYNHGENTIMPTRVDQRTVRHTPFFATEEIANRAIAHVGERYLKTYYFAPEEMDGLVLGQLPYVASLFFKEHNQADMLFPAFGFHYWGRLNECRGYERAYERVGVFLRIDGNVVYTALASDVGGGTDSYFFNMIYLPSIMEEGYLFAPSRNQNGLIIGYAHRCLPEMRALQQEYVEETMKYAGEREDFLNNV